MKSIPAAPMPFVPRIPGIVGPRRIPFAAKVAATLFLAVLIPVYWHSYGIRNFLWFCDAALILAVAGMWLESPILISACAVGILVPQCLWLLDFGAKLLGMHLLGLTDYMFDPGLPLLSRALSLFHGWFPVLLIWLLLRVGYHTLALPVWSCIAAMLLLAGYLFAPPAGAVLADPNSALNLNYAYGFNDRQPQILFNPHLYVFLWYGALWFLAFLPAHLVLRKL
ncbi:MAG TPA: hypothetical protein VK968_12335, partial [Roseimicrobium sp.]|nr:hypothetical protein [Roseimicrobium sp.]